RLRDGAFLEPVFRYQLVGDSRNGAALKASAPGEIGTGNGLMVANEIEHDPAIDVASSLTSGDAKVAQVYFSHDRPGNLFSPRTISRPTEVCPQKNSEFAKGWKVPFTRASAGT